MNRHPLAQLQRLSTIPAHLPDAFSASWQSPSNIALVKYWGKKEGQLPANPSLSMTLDEAVTRTTVHFRRDGTPGIGPVNGDPAHPFLPRLQGLFAWLVKEVPVLSHYSLEVVTESTFPHSTGIASSASGLSAFALCLLDAATGLTGTVCTQEDTMRMASFVSRIGSGSACRSLYGGFAVWGRTRLIPGSSDEYAFPVTDNVHPSMRSLRDAILVISRQPKALSSSLGHRAMENHPFASS
ncbi:MAG TPA: hypothetical protein PLK82_04560, partial [Bacteroidales bacterium]|nr:hypothetical protein [Bacteroidales bacterium]